MPLAAPLILPFAELAGITVAGLGMAAASKKVSDFISANPETSMEILNMIVPGSKGLETLFKKKATISLEDVEDMTDEEAADLSKEDKAEIMKEVGKSKGGDKRQRMIEISEKLGLSGEGKEKQTIIDEVEERYDEGGVEDAPKPKFDYKKFFRKDGGRIGYQDGGNIIGADLKTIDEETAPPGPNPFLGTTDYQGNANAIQRPPQGILSRAIQGTQNLFSSIKDNLPNFGIIGLLNNLDRFDTLPMQDRQFILDQAGGNRPNKDPFGINIRSAFGNYADYVRNKGIFAPGARGEYYRSLNIPGLDTAMKETVAREQRAKEAFEKQIRDAANAAAREQARVRSIESGYGGYDYSSGATGATAAGAGMGVGGGYASDYGFKDGGVITLFVETK